METGLVAHEAKLQRTPPLNRLQPCARHLGVAIGFVSAALQIEEVRNSTAAWCCTEQLCLVLRVEYLGMEAKGHKTLACLQRAATSKLRQPIYNVQNVSASVHKCLMARSLDVHIDRKTGPSVTAQAQRGAEQPRGIHASMYC